MLMFALLVCKAFCHVMMARRPSANAALDLDLISFQCDETNKLLLFYLTCVFPLQQPRVV